MTALVLLLAAGGARAQTVVEMDLQSAARLLENHKFGRAVIMLEGLANNYKKYTNVRVRSNWHQDYLAELARALHTDFDGSGNDYIPDHTIWCVDGTSGDRVFLKASLVDAKTVLLASDLDNMRSMSAFEILQQVRSGKMALPQAEEISKLLGVEMQVIQDETGGLAISFFGRVHGEETLSSRLFVVEPPELVWD